VQYISKVLFAPETARKWADTLQSEIAKLDFMPSRYPLTEEEPWHTKEQESSMDYGSDLWAERSDCGSDGYVV